MNAQVDLSRHLGDKCLEIFDLSEWVYRWFYGRKFRFTATRSGAVKRKICERKTTDIPPQIENFKTLIPILMQMALMLDIIRFLVSLDLLVMSVAMTS